jgi:hypothetical protein
MMFIKRKNKNKDNPMEKMYDNSNKPSNDELVNMRNSLLLELEKLI